MSSRDFPSTEESLDPLKAEKIIDGLNRMMRDAEEENDKFILDESGNWWPIDSHEDSIFLDDDETRKITKDS